MNRNKMLMTVLGMLAVGVLFFGCSAESNDPHKDHQMQKETSETAALYICPMHPEVTSDKKGRCPKCNMFLVPKNETESMDGPEEDAHLNHEMKEMEVTKATPALYHCPMHPTFTSDKPGDCGICGMSLVPVDLEGGHESNVPGQASVKLSDRRKQLIGVKISTASKRVMTETIRTVGRIAFDPELYRAQEEYLGALDAYRNVRKGSLPEVTERASSLVKSSELRLRLLGLSDRQIRELSRGGGPDQSLLISSGKGKTVWLYVDVFEYELPLVKVGQKVTANSISVPGFMFEGRVKAIDSVINPKTRSARVRAEIENTDGLLKPDMYLNAMIHVVEGEKLAVPREAVMETGLRSIVFVDQGDGFFEPREVLLGERSGDYVHIKSGLMEGERIVTSGNFLIDSESKLKAALSSIAGGHQH